MIIVDTELPLISFSNPLGFITQDISTDSSFLFKDPFAWKDLLMVRRFNEVPSVAANERSELFFRCLELFIMVFGIGGSGTMSRLHLYGLVVKRPLIR